jgi:hypothetical protein
MSRRAKEAQSDESEVEESKTALLGLVVFRTSNLLVARSTKYQRGFVFRGTKTVGGPRTNKDDS